MITFKFHFTCKWALAASFSTLALIGIGTVSAQTPAEDATTKSSEETESATTTPAPHVRLDQLVLQRLVVNVADEAELDRVGPGRLA